MEIYKKNSTSVLKKIKSRLRVSSLLKLISVFTLICVISFASLVYGAYLNSTGRTYNIKMALQQISRFDFSFIQNSFEGKLVEIEKFDIDVKFKDWEKIRYNRYRPISSGEEIIAKYKEEVPAKIRYNNQVYKVGISLTGGDHDHINHPYKWSLLVKVKKGKSIMGMTKFALLNSAF